MKKLIIFFLLFLSLPLFAQQRVQMVNKDGVLYVPCKVNGLSLDFIFDTVGSDFSISSSEAVFMVKNGYIDER